MATVTFENVRRSYPGSDRPAVDRLDLDIADGELLVLVGPSGCGKSTTLRMLAGLDDNDDGRIFIGDRDVTSVPPKDRDIAMVFQNYALYPHMTVAENMGFALRLAKIGKAERASRVARAAEMLDLTAYLDRKPKALSGGQRQRVAMGRAIVRSPQVFCMDEPLSNLDAKMRVRTRTDIAALQAELGVTTVYVTHDQVEAMTLGSRVAVMRDGVIQQVDTPLALYDRPANEFVAGFIGSPQMNLLPGVATDGGVRLADDVIPLRTGVRGPVTVGIRPEDWTVTSDPSRGLGAQVTLVEKLGSDSYVYAATEIDGRRQTVVVRAPARGTTATGDLIRLTADPERVHLFDSVTGRRVD
ncbi:sn-glycerol-3-phosphate ABC transporter ATP-binding protein UgpC [Gordonia sp. HNM0687]|uniref:Trehalose import ATP-binding protein SugC n=1 Tax=Gordonia mangrovi TaxID=2665643 RepID=A0A6L7GLH7_9ACTN|nr:ABC transporter ATP-binding protein [Gordonia mangrovi]MXP20726.1 sn-glycerol-3-phosphate ABC transporter ATP-binding protein UgpC [Gordonia mangrovi]UVF78703.1 ABC transporter ATP-binding protein [Gordonia mangrovi]